MEKDRIVLHILSEIKEDEGVPIKEQEKIIEAPFQFARDILRELDIKDMSLEEFRNTKKNFNIPGFGKLYAKEEIFYNLNKKKSDE